ncbi:MAG: carboxylesterase family protein [Bacteroidota bacterium]
MNKILLLLTVCFSFSALKSQTVSTQFGEVVGATNGAIKEFLGIPFAKPPVGNLRWKAPENPTNWTIPLNTTAFAPECPQKKFEPDGSSAIVGNEDCLYLNVWTPQTSNTANLPVMVFIHGGGNQQGSTSVESGSTPMYAGENLSERGDVVVVTIQYRLGPLGFLVHPGLEPETANSTSGNYAAMDQILALNWVKNNIANFGGNPENVTIFGESAGAVNVGNLLTTPLANGLFDRAIMQSGGPVIGNYLTLRNLGVTFVNDFTTTGTNVDKIAFMRTVSSDDLVADQTQPLSGGVVGMNWASTIDNVVFFDYPANVVQNGLHNHVPVMIGSNKDEMSLSIPPTVTPAMMSTLIAGAVPAAFQTQAAILYPPGSTNAVARDSYVRLLTDKQFTATSRRTAECLSKNQNEPVFRYFFTQKHSIAALQPYGAYHGMELFYIFNTWENTIGGQAALFSDQDDSTQNVCLDYWTNFAANGNPNGGTLANWSVYSATTDCYMDLKATPDGTNCGLRTAESDFWDDVISYIPCTALLSVEEMMEKGFQIQCFPNPSNSVFNFEIPEKLSNYSIEVHSLSGELIMKLVNKKSIDLSHLENSVYIAHVIFNDQLIGRTRIIKID